MYCIIYYIYYYTFKISTYILKILFDTERHGERGNTSRGSERGEAGFPSSREPDVGLDPRTLGS